MAIAISCSQLFLEPEPGEDPVTVFNLFWEEFDKHYPFFDIKQVDWDSLYKERDNLLNFYFDQNSEYENRSERALFDALSAIIKPLYDGHVQIYSSFDSSYSRNFFFINSIDSNLTMLFEFELISKKYLVNYKILSEEYLEHIYGWYKNYVMIYGNLDYNIGYLRIGTFDEDCFSSIDIDNSFKQLSEYKGLIIDIRDNKGGHVSLLENFAARFTTENILYGYEKIRNGPSHNDFSELEPLWIRPSVSTIFKGQVAVLINIYTACGAEQFALILKTMSHATIIGDTTIGCIASTLSRELPNGWQYSMPNDRLLDRDKQDVEDRGVIPDIIVPPDPYREAEERDEILETAISFLKERVGTN